MGILFISHSSRDNQAAIKVRDWLKTNGWGEVFLDLDPEQGLAAGHRWQQELKQAGERCSGVVVLLSPDWIASRWCQTEFLIADQLGKKIFPLFVAPTQFDELPIELKAKYQVVDISTPGKEVDGFARLAIGLKRSGLDPRSFPWPPPNDPHRPIYRGLESLDEQDAAIFFGRDALITKGLDTLRRMRDGAPERVLVILGASGAGKSSFLKAGLLARLKRDEENFLVLPVVRPERAALTGPQGLAASVGIDPSRLNDIDDLANAIAIARAGVLERFRRFADNTPEARVAAPPTIIVPVDQGEELFAAENSEAQRAVDLLMGAIRADRNMLVVAAIRSDAFAKLQGRPRIVEIPLQPFSLPTIPLGAFKEVIEGPARLAEPPLSIEPALSDRLLQDLAAEDALPLLAFTLERLASRHRGGGTLTLAEYSEKLGGLQGAIVGAVEAAFSEARRDPALPQSHAELELLARTAFIPCLVNLDDADAQPRRRVEKLSALPEAAQPLVRHLINQRLLVSNRTVIDGVEADTVEVTHEAILRQWPALRAWIAEERDALRTLDSVRAAAAEWQSHRDARASKSGQSWLVHRGGRLQEAEALFARPGFGSGFGSGEREYISSCRNYENSELVREQQALARTRKLQRNIGILITAAAVVVLLAGIGIVQLVAGLAAGSRDSLLTQAAKDAELGNYGLSARYALAGLAAAGLAHRGGLPVALVEAELRGSASESSAVADLLGHTNQVLGADFSPDEKLVVTASRDGTARIWDVGSGDTVRFFRGRTGAVYGADFSPDGKRVATAYEDGTARIWNVNTGALVLTLKGHQDIVYGAVFSFDGKRVVTASADDTARIWDSMTGAKLVQLKGHEGAVYDAVFSRNGEFVVTASDDKTARIWDAVTGNAISTLSGNEGRVNSAVFSPDGRLIATASDDGTARIWDAQSGHELRKLPHDNYPVNSVAFNFDGTRLATASKDNAAHIWDVGTGQEEGLIRGHDGAVNSVAFSSQGKYLVTTSDDRTARLWDANLHVTVLRGHDDVINGVAYSSDGRLVATASSDTTARIWDSFTGRELVVLDGHKNLVESVAFSPDGKRLVTGSDDRTARVWDTRSGRQLLVLSGARGKIYGVTVSPDGTAIAAACTDGTLHIWNAQSGQSMTVITASARPLNSVAFSPDGSRMVSASNDGTARVWVRASTLDPVVLHQGGIVFSATFNSDGTRIVTAGEDKTAVIWDSRSAQRLKTLAGHEDRVMTAAFSPDGKRVITASHDRTARLWDAQTGAQIAIFRGNASFLESAAFSPDGKRVVTGSDDATARVLNVSDIDSASGPALVQRICETSLARGLSTFSVREIRAVPVLDARLDVDACHPPSLWARLDRIFLAGISQ